jgi:uncharacterized protein (DUF302 family)
MTEYGYAVEVPEGYDEAVVRARLAFRGEGFSILSEMHVGGHLGPESGDERQYLIMGVWNAPLENRPIDEGGDVRVAVHLPCNLVVQETGKAALVAALDPADGAEEADVPEETRNLAREALSRVLARVGESD